MSGYQEDCNCALCTVIRRADECIALRQKLQNIRDWLNVPENVALDKTERGIRMQVAALIAESGLTRAEENKSEEYKPDDSKFYQGIRLPPGTEFCEACKKPITPGRERYSEEIKARHPECCDNWSSLVILPEPQFPWEINKER